MRQPLHAISAFPILPEGTMSERAHTALDPRTGHLIGGHDSLIDLLSDLIYGEQQGLLDALHHINQDTGETLLQASEAMAQLGFIIRRTHMTWDKLPMPVLFATWRTPRDSVAMACLIKTYTSDANDALAIALQRTRANPLPIPKSLAA
jgi:hypothetical protein